MRILHQGIKPKAFPWIGRYLCPHCNSVFQIGEEDVDLVTSWSDDQRDGLSVTIHCPICDQSRGLMQLEYTSTYHGNKAMWDRLKEGETA